MKIAREGEPDKFLTLTCKPSMWPSPDLAAQGMRDAFARLIRMIRKSHPGRTIEYLRVFEAHKSGWPHLHILMRMPFVQQKWLSEIWEALTGAFKVDIREVKNVGHAAFYISKYIGKDLHKFEGVTRWFRSKLYSKPKDDTDKPMRFGDKWGKIDQTPQEYFWRKALELKGGDYVIEQYRLGYLQWRHKLRSG